MNIMIVFLSLILCLHAGPKLQPDHTSLDKPEDVSESVSKVVSKFDADFTEKEGSENIIYLDEKKYSLSEIMYDHNDELRQKMMNRFDHIKQYSEMAELLSSELLQKVRGIFEAQGHKDFDENIVQAFAYSKFMSEGDKTDEDILRRYSNVNTAMQNESQKNEIMKLYNSFKPHILKNSEIHEVYLRQFFTLREKFNKEEYFDDHFFRVQAFWQALILIANNNDHFTSTEEDIANSKLFVPNLLDRPITSVENIIQKSKVLEMDKSELLNHESYAKRLFDESILHIQNGNSIWFVIIKNAVEDLMLLPNQATHIVLNMYYDEAEGLEILQVSDSKKLQINLKKFCELYEKNREFKERVSIEVMELFGPKIKALNLRDTAFTSIEDIFTEIGREDTAKQRGIFFHEGIRRFRSPEDHKDIWFFVHKSLLGRLMKLPYNTTHIVLKMNYDLAKHLKVVKVASSGPFKDQAILILESFVKNYHDNDELKATSTIHVVRLGETEFSHSEPLINKEHALNLSNKPITAVDKIIERIMISEHQIQFLLKRGMLRYGIENLFYLLVSKQELGYKIKLAEEATHIVFTMNFDKLKDLNLMKNSRKYPGELYLDRDRCLELIYEDETLKGGMISIETMRLVDDEYDPVFLYDKPIRKEYEIFDKADISGKNIRFLLKNGFLNKNPKDGNLFWSILDKDILGKLIKLPEEANYIVFEMDYKKAIDYGLLILKTQSAHVFNLRKFMQFYAHDPSLQGSIKSIETMNMAK